MDDIERQRQLAMLLQQQGQAPQGQMVSGRYVAPSWSQYLANGLANYRGQQMASDADAKQKAMDAQRQAWLESVPQAKKAETLDLAQVDPSMAQYGSVETAPAKDPSSDDYLMWALKGMKMDPQAAELGLKMGDRQEARRQQREQAQALREQRMQELQMRMQDARLSAQERMQAQQEAARLQREFQAEMAHQNREQQMSMARLTASMRPPPEPHLVQVEGPDGNPQFVPSSQAIGKKPYNAKEAGGGSKVSDAKDAIALIDQADALLDKSTHSGIGRGVDLLAGGIGMSTQGAQAAAQLKAIEGMLVSKMPKMSGPQSDKDVLLYKQMAAQVGDPMIPIETRRAALKTVREIQERYAGGTQPSAPQGRNITVDW